MDAPRYIKVAALPINNAAQATIRDQAMQLPASDGLTLTTHQKLSLLYLTLGARHLRASKVYSKSGQLAASQRNIRDVTDGELAQLQLRRSDLPYTSSERYTEGAAYRKVKIEAKRNNTFVDGRTLKKGQARNRSGSSSASNLELPDDFKANINHQIARAIELAAEMPESSHEIEKDILLPQNHPLQGWSYNLVMTDSLTNRQTSTFGVEDWKCLSSPEQSFGELVYFAGGQSTGVKVNTLRGTLLLPAGHPTKGYIYYFEIASLHERFDCAISPWLDSGLDYVNNQDERVLHWNPLDATPPATATNDNDAWIDPSVKFANAAAHGISMNVGLDGVDIGVGVGVGIGRGGGYGSGAVSEAGSGAGRDAGSEVGLVVG